MSMTTKRFDVAEYLETAEDIREFLKEAAETGTEAEFIHALNTAARAKGMSEVAKAAGVTRASLYKSLSEGSNPSYMTISKVVKALGCKLDVA